MERTQSIQIPYSVDKVTSGFSDQTIMSKGAEFFGGSHESSFVGVDLTGVECARRFGQWTSGF